MRIPKPGASRRTKPSAHRRAGSSIRRRRRRILLSTLGAVAVLAVICGVLVWSGTFVASGPSTHDVSAGLGDATPDPIEPEVTDEPAPATIADPMVLAISIDGLNPESVAKLGRSGTPNFHRLIDEGAWTFNARTTYEVTETLPNHTGMMTGRSRDGSAGHGVDFNSDNDKTLAKTNDHYIPGMFDVAHDAGLQTALFAEKDKFNYLLRSWDGKNGAADTTGEDNGRDKIDAQAIAGAGTLVSRTIAAINDGQTDLIFLHLMAPDDAGHDHGWMRDDYLDAVRNVDANLGKLLAAIDANPRAKAGLTLLLTADHGGKAGEKSHDDVDELADYRIPFLAWGAGVAKGVDLYSINPARRDPGTSRPGYSGMQPIRNMDIADTALRLLHLSPIHGAVTTSWPAVNVGVSSLALPSPIDTPTPSATATELPAA